MPIERETIVERPVRTENVIVERRSPFGIIGAVIAALIVIAVIVWAVNGGITGNTDSINVDVPEVTVTQ